MTDARPAGRYQRGRLLGRGGMGEVFLAEDLREGRSVALKFLNSHLGREAGEFFKEEVQLLSRLSHPHLVKIFDYFEGEGPHPNPLPQGERGTRNINDNGEKRKIVCPSPLGGEGGRQGRTGEGPTPGPYFAMEYVSGATLDRIPKETPAAQWIAWFAQLAQGLHYLHSRKILHGDLKPSNILVTEAGEIKLLDFGLSALLTRQEKSSALGTLAYMPPEAFWGEYDAQSDLFSLGVLFYEMLSGRLPFTRPLSGGVEKLSPPESLHDRRSDLPEYFCTLIHRLLEIRPDQRPPSALSLLKILNQHSETPFEIVGEESSQLILQKVPMVGRGAEEKIFWETLESATGPLSIVIAGPTGVGRSRFLEEMKWGIQLKGLPYVSIGPAESHSWLKIILEALGLKTDAMATGDFLSRIHTLIKNPPTKKTLLALTDLHLWSESALQELQVFFRLLGEVPHWIFLLEYSSDLAPDALRPLLESLPHRTVLNLQDLTPEQTRELLVQASIDAPLKEREKVEVIEGSGGRPLLALEAVHHLLSKPLTPPGQESVSSVPPKSLQEVTALRVKSLPEAQRELLALVVSHPDPVALHEARALWTGTSETLDSALLSLDRMGFFAARRGTDPGLRLAHPSLRSSYIESLEGARLVEAHRRWLKELAEKKPEARLLYPHAVGAEDAEALKKWGLLAAEEYLAQGKNLAAIEVYQRMYRAATSAYEHSFAQAHLAPIFYRLGRFDEALGAYDLWFKDREDDATFLQKVKHRFYTGLVLHTSNREEQARDRLTECLRIGDSTLHPAHRPYHARAHNLLASLDERHGLRQEARSHLEFALSLAQDHPLLMGEIEQRLGHLAQLEMDYGRSALHYEKSREHFHAAKNPQAEAIAHNLLGMLNMECGNLEAARASMATSLELARQGGDLLQWARYRVNASLVFLEIGRYSQAAEGLEEGRLLLSSLGNSEDRLLTELHRLSLYTYLGNWERTLQILRVLQNSLPELTKFKLLPQWYFILGELIYCRGRSREALAYYAASQNKGAAKTIDLALAEVGSWKTGQRLGQTPTLHLPPQAKTPSFEPWQAAAEFFEEAEIFPSERFKQLLLKIKACEKPEWRLDLYDLLARHLKRQGQEAWAERLHASAQIEFQGMLQNLAEEYRMDFEKNREPKSLDETLEALLPTAPSAAPALPVPETGKPATRPQISETRFRQFSEINRQISQKNDLKEILERVMDAAIELTGAERGFLLLKKEGATVKGFAGFDIKTARHLNQGSLQEAEFQFSLTAVEQAIQQGTSLLTDNAQLDPRFQERKSVVQYQLKSILAVPLEIEGHILGAIYLDHRYQPGCFSEEDVVLLNAFTSQAALAIQKAQIIEELRQAKQKLEVRVEDQAKEIETLHGELAMVRDELRYEYKEIVGQSPSMMQVFQLLDHVTETTIPVWILGESGTGKELIAHALHHNSPRKDGQFVSENCSAIPETLLESELFGHKRGAFTHADRDRVGLFEQANHGTLFLDEIADMPMSMQVKLLRVLQEGEVRPLGANKKVKIDVRLVTASNRDLNQMVKAGTFRQDLFFRINGLTIKLPPLRERKDDIPLLVNHIIEKVARTYNLKASELSDEAFQKLLRHSWPGNIRELEGVMRNALLFAKGRLITPELLSIPDGRSTEGTALPAAMGRAMPSEEESAERQFILDALKRNGLDKEKAAGELGISLRSLYTRMEKLNIPKKKTVLAKYLDIK